LVTSSLRCPTACFAATFLSTIRRRNSPRAPSNRANNPARRARPAYRTASCGVPVSGAPRPDRCPGPVPLSRNARCWKRGPGKLVSTFPDHVLGCPLGADPAWNQGKGNTCCVSCISSVDRHCPLLCCFSRWGLAVPLHRAVPMFAKLAQAMRCSFVRNSFRTYPASPSVWSPGEGT
jgi:hypothetical protein